MAINRCIVVTTSNGFVEAVKQCIDAAGFPYRLVESTVGSLRAREDLLREGLGILVLDATEDESLVAEVLELFFASWQVVARFQIAVAQAVGRRGEDVLRDVPSARREHVVTIPWDGSPTCRDELTRALRHAARISWHLGTREVIGHAQPCPEACLACLVADLEGYSTVISQGGDRERGRGRSGDPWEQLVEVLDLMTELERLVRKYHGIVKEYPGDAIYAVFRAPGDDHRSALVAAIRAAQAMEREAKTKPPLTGQAGLSLHVGIDCGTVVWLTRPEQRLSDGPGDPSVPNQPIRVRSPGGTTVISAFRLASVRPHDLVGWQTDAGEKLAAERAAEKRRGLILVPADAFDRLDANDQRSSRETDDQGAALPSFWVDLKGSRGRRRVRLIKRLEL